MIQKKSFNTGFLVNFMNRTGRLMSNGPGRRYWSNCLKSRSSVPVWAHLVRMSIAEHLTKMFTDNWAQEPWQDWEPISRKQNHLSSALGALPPSPYPKWSDVSRLTWHDCRVCTAPGDRVPGPRSYALLAPVEFPWRTAVDHIEEVGSHDSYSLSLDLTRNGLVCGPSSGFNLQGLYQFIAKRKTDGSLDELRGADGEIHCAFLCCDLPYQYISEYFDKLGDSFFPAVTNEVWWLMAWWNPEWWDMVMANRKRFLGTV